MLRGLLDLYFLSDIQCADEVNTTPLTQPYTCGSSSRIIRKRVSNPRLSRKFKF